MLFVTGGDPVCEALARSAAGKRYSFPRSLRGSVVVVFDAALSVEDLKAYIAKLGMVGPVARVKDGPNHGRDNGRFRFFSVKKVPTWVVVDRAGHPRPIDLVAMGPNLYYGDGPVRH